MSGARVQVWSSGGGVQSAAIAALIVQGKLRPDVAVIVDTEREQSTTWHYMDDVISPALASVGLTLHRVAKSEFATVDLWGGKGKDSLLIPVFTTQGGDIGKLPTYCSNEWKRRVVRRWATKMGIIAADIWLGISTDEIRRLSPGNGKWCNRFPLVEQRMNRADCMALVAQMGWPSAPRSSCYMCPNHTQTEWRDIRDNKPADWRAAVKFDRDLRMTDPHAFVHSDAVSLDQASLDNKNGSLFEHCDSGHCFT